MTKDEAHKIINDLLNASIRYTIAGRIRYLIEAGYPELAEIYNDFITSNCSARDFYTKAEYSLIIGSTKLGKALK